MRRYFVGKLVPPYRRPSPRPSVRPKVGEIGGTPYRIPLFLHQRTGGGGGVLCSLSNPKTKIGYLLKIMNELIWSIERNAIRLP